MTPRLQRKQVPLLNGEGPPDEDSIRVYYPIDGSTPPMPSVTTIEDLRVDPSKENALQGWRDSFDGKSKWARPWYNDQKVFKGHRGTIIHFAILSELGDASGETYFHRVGNDDKGKEEYYSEYCLKKWSKKAPSANTDEISFSPRNNKYDGEHAWDRAMRDTKWATRAFKREVLDTGHFHIDDVIDVEAYVFDTEYGYGGQFDLLYEAPDGRVILSDLKTSSGVRFDHKLQGAAYKRCVEDTYDITVDETEIIRLYPDKEEVEITRSSEWEESLRRLEHEFLALACQAWDSSKDGYRETLRAAQEELSEHSQSSQSELSEVEATT